MIAKAMSHEPNILFLDEPTAGVDVELRQSLWKNLYDLKKNGGYILFNIWPDIKGNLNMVKTLKYKCSKVKNN